MRKSFFLLMIIIISMFMLVTFKGNISSRVLIKASKGIASNKANIINTYFRERAVVSNNKQFSALAADKIASITTNGWAWRDSVSLENKTAGIVFNNTIDIAIARRPDNSDVYLVAVLDSFRKNVSGTLYLVSYIDVFVVNYTQPTINKYDATPSVYFVYRYNYTRPAEDYDRIVKIAIDWINNTDAYIIFANASRPSGNTDYYSVVVVHISSNTPNWTLVDERIIIRGEGPIKGLSIYRTSTRFLVVFATISFVSFFNTLSPNITFYEIFSGDYSSVSFQVSGYSVSELWLSNAYITNDGWGLVVVAAKITDGFSMLYSVSWDFVINSDPQFKPIYETTDLGDEHGVYADFKDPAIAPINNEDKFIVAFDAFTSVDDYLTYGISSYGGGDLSNLNNVVLNFEISSAARIRSIDYNITDNLVLLFWLDATVGANEIRYAQLNVSDTPVLGPTNYSVVTNTKTVTFSLALRSAKDLVVAHISKNASGFAKAYVAIGFFDSDKDGLGDYEEENIYSTTYPGILYNDPDSDKEGLGDGAEILLYDTSPIDNDTDNDNITDYDEVIIYDTNPLDKDTDNDNLSDGEEILGIKVYIPSNGTYVIMYSNPHVNDTDDDGLSDYFEVKIGWECSVVYPDGAINSYYVKSNPNSTDSDSDGFPDIGEYINGTDPWINDTDRDGIIDIKEVSRGTNPCDWDSDDDNLSDYDEVVVYGTDPLSNDSDGDGLSDYQEIIEGWTVTVILQNGTTVSYKVNSSAIDYDTDGDNLNDYLEYSLGSDPRKNDTDGDKLSDAKEYSRGTDPCDWDSDDDNLSDYDEVVVYGTDPLSNDSDGDGLSDYQEVTGVYNPYLNRSVITDPNSWDSDDDGLSDYNESMGFNISGVIYYTDPLDSDTDNDKLSDGDEYWIGTSPINNDSDGDSLLDGDEANGVNITGIGVRYPDPLSNDTDGDGLDDGSEVNTYHTDPTEYDSDYDGLSDREELVGWDVTAITKNGTITYHVESNPLNWDSDGDGLSDYDERDLRSNPLNNDTDNDGLSDSSESSLELNVTNWDTDGDNLSDYEEVVIYNTDPLNRDSDGDNLSDHDEIKLYSTNPLDWDSDGDSLSDYEEVIVYGTNPNIKDTDNDSISDWDEIAIYSTDPLKNDTDNDNLTDGLEVQGINITGVGVRSTDPLSNDTDGDGLSDYEECFGVKMNGKVYTSDPTDRDTDDDGLDDYQEVKIYLTNPLDRDSDSDGLMDGEEVAYGTSPINNDTDGDGLSDYYEKIHSLNPLSNDTDNDNLTDLSEIMVYGTDPLNRDTDGDGLSDYDEVIVYGTDPRKSDSDNDRLDDYQEVIVYSTNPLDNDTDGDGLSDYDEVIVYGTDPSSIDTDGDNLSDYDEVNGVFVDKGIGVVRTDPLSNDTDKDGLLDKQEITGFNLPRYGLVKTNPADRDTDGDGLSDYEEVVVRKTNPRSRDSDGDGLSDYDEVMKLATNPNSVDSDHDFIPDNMDVLFPNVNNFLILAIIALFATLIYARNYGLMRNWRKDIILFGLSDAGGIPMFVVPEDVQTKYDINLISSGLLGVYAITGEISGEHIDTLVLSGKTPIFVRKGEKTVAWVFLRKTYPRIIKKLIAIHEELETNYAHLLEEWSGMPDEVEEVKYWLLSRLGKGSEEFKTDEKLLEEFEKEFGE